MADVANITAAQRIAINRLASVLPPDAYLAGGLAIALRLGHRTSLDIDVFLDPSDPQMFVDRLAQLPDTTVVSRAPGTVHLEVGDVPASLLQYVYPSVAPPEEIAGLALRAAALSDLTAMKLSAIAGRGAAKDFWDLHALVEHREISLRDALAEFRLKFAQHDVGSVVRSLAYFGDADAEPLPRGLTRSAWAQLKRKLSRGIIDLES